MFKIEDKIIVTKGQLIFIGIIKDGPFTENNFKYYLVKDKKGRSFYVLEKDLEFYTE